MKLRKKEKWEQVLDTLWNIIWIFISGCFAIHDISNLHTLQNKWILLLSYITIVLEILFFILNTSYFVFFTIIKNCFEEEKEIKDEI